MTTHQPPPETPPAKPARRFGWLHLIGVGIVMMLVGVAIGASGGEKEAAPTTARAAATTTTTSAAGGAFGNGTTTTSAATTTRAPTTTAAPTTTTPPEPRVVLEISGTDRKNSESFTITTGRFDVAWQYEGDSNFVVRLVNESTGRGSLLVNRIDSGSDTTLVRERGTFYLEVGPASGSWSITVTERP